MVSQFPIHDTLASMNTEHIVQLLVQERDRLNRAIEALKGASPKRRGRPPKNPLAVQLDAVESFSPAPKKRKPFSKAAKRKMRLAQKKRWAAIKAAK
jgi:hypothetical protein